MSTRQEHSFGYSPRQRGPEQSPRAPCSALHRRTFSLPVVQASLPLPPRPPAQPAATLDEAQEVLPSQQHLTHILSNTSDTVKVLVRVRPPNVKEQSHGYIRCVKQTSNETLLVTGGPDPQHFTFDYVAGADVTQETLFTIVGAPIVESVLEGYNACIFAYGQTGSGKTYTMLGDLPEGPSDMPMSAGLTPRVIRHLFTCMSNHHNGVYGVRCSLLEIYNETITDLLWPDATNLQVREDNKNGTYVEGLTEEPISSVEEAVELMQRGAANRTIAETNMNTESSRSHCVMTIIIEGKVKDDIGTKNLFARLNLVDLAGSERQRATGALGERLKEASSINKSLSTLGHVIMSLADAQHGRGKHIPYRDSKLTFLLQDSLGGNAKTVMIANASPAKTNISETLSTLRFARGAKKIKNKAVVNEDYGCDVEALKREIDRLKEELALFRRSPRSVLQRVASSPDAASLPDSSSHNSRSASPRDSSSEDDGSLLSRTLSQPPKALDKELDAALRREQEQEKNIGTLRKELVAARDIIATKDDDVQKSKLIIKFRDDKIIRLQESLKDASSPACESAREVEMENLEKELALHRQHAETPSGDWSKHAVENSQLREQIALYQKTCNVEAQAALEEDVRGLRQKCLELNEEVRRYKQFDPEEVRDRAHEAASRAVSLASRRLEETMAKAARVKKEAAEQALLLASMKEEMEAERAAQKGLGEQLDTAVREAEATKIDRQNAENVLRDMQQERDCAVDKSNALVQQIEEQKMELQECQQEISKLKTSNIDLEENCSGLVLEVESLKQEMESVLMAKLELEEKAASTDEESQLQEELLGVKEELKRREQELVDIAARYSDRQKALTSEKNQLGRKAKEAERRVQELQEQMESDGAEVKHLFEENLLLQLEDKKLRAQISALVEELEALKNSHVDTVELRIEVTDQDAGELEKHETMCKSLTAQLEDLEAKCEDLNVKALAGEKAAEELLAEKAARQGIEATCTELRQELSELQEHGGSAEDMACMAEEIAALKDQNAKISKEKSDLDVLCNNLVDELDEKHDNVAVHLAKSKALGEQVAELQEDKQRLMEEVGGQSVRINVHIEGGDDSDWMKEEIEDLRDELALKELSIKNMDVLLKGLLEENERLKAKQAQSEEAVHASAKRQKELEEKVASQEQHQAVLTQRLSFSRSLLVRRKDTDEDQLSSDTSDPSPDAGYTSEVESSTSSGAAVRP